VSWRLAGVAEAMARTVPCFISWGHRDDFDVLGGTGISDLALGGDVDEISAWLAGAVDGLRLVGGAPGIRQLTIATPRGDVVLPEQP
jgi:hypothetical protein